MKQLLTVITIMVCACLTQGFTPKGASYNGNTVSAKPAFNYSKFMKSLWIHPTPKRYPSMLAGYTLDVQNWTDSKVNIDYIAIYNYANVYYYYIMDPWNTNAPIEPSSSANFWDWADRHGDLIIGVTVLGPSETGDRFLWLEDYFGNTIQCKGNVLTSGEYIFNDVYMGNGRWLQLNAWEYCNP